MKKIISFILAVCIISGVFCTTALADEQIVNVYVDGEKIVFDVDPIVENGRTLVPIRAISEYLKYEVDWDNEKWEAEIKNDGNTMVIGVGKTAYTKNGEKKEMDVPAKLVNGRTLVPLRLIAENFGCDVKWDGATYSAYIETQTKSKEEMATEPVDNWTPDFTDYSKGSINDPLPANTMYNGADGFKKTNSKLLEYLEYQSSSDDSVKNIRIKSYGTTEGTEALELISEFLDDDESTELKPEEGQDWWTHRIALEYVSGEGLLNLNELIFDDNMYTSNGEKYKIHKSFIYYKKNIYTENEPLEITSGESCTFYYCTLIDMTSSTPLLKIAYNEGNDAKFIHLNSYKTETEDEQLGIEPNLPTRNPNKVDGDLANESNDLYNAFVKSQINYAKSMVNKYQNQLNSALSERTKGYYAGGRWHQTADRSAVERAQDNLTRWSDELVYWESLLD